MATDVQKCIKTIASLDKKWTPDQAVACEHQRHLNRVALFAMCSSFLEQAGHAKDQDPYKTLSHLLLCELVAPQAASPPLETVFTLFCALTSSLATKYNLKSADMLSHALIRALTSVVNAWIKTLHCDVTDGTDAAANDNALVHVIHTTTKSKWSVSSRLTSSSSDSDITNDGGPPPSTARKRKKRKLGALRSPDVGKREKKQQQQSTRLDQWYPMLSSHDDVRSTAPTTTAATAGSAAQALPKREQSTTTSRE